MFSLTKIKPRIYHLEFTTHYDLCMCFLRYQEAYESTEDRFKTSSFTLVDYMKWYTLNSSRGKSKSFRYIEDWTGFNIPLDVIKNVRDRGITDPNMYDSLFSGIYDMITACGEYNCYLIGSQVGELKTMKHELVHAEYFTNVAYRTKVLSEIRALNVELYDELSTLLKNLDYSVEVLDDEINAYLVAGDTNCFSSLTKKQGFKTLKKKLISLFDECETKA